MDEHTAKFLDAQDEAAGIPKDSKDSWRSIETGGCAPPVIVRADDGPITDEEMNVLFDETMPAEAVNLLFNADGTATIGELRAKLRAIAVARARRLRTQQWHDVNEILPEIGSKFVLVCPEGSGAQLLFRHDGGFFDADGCDDAREDVEHLRRCGGLWSYLPAGFKFWCESGQDALNLPEWKGPSHD